MDSTLRHVTGPNDQVFALITGSRLNHQFPINSQKVAGESVQKMLKICYFIFEAAVKLLNFEKAVE